DRYGFKKSTQYVTESEYDAWNATYNVYLDRRKKKWIEFMGREGLLVNRRLDKEIPVRFPARSDKTKRYIRKGVPPEWRGAAWFWYAGGPERLRKHSDLYPDLVRRIEAGKLSESDGEHIERDLFRTFPDNIRFKPDSSPNPPPIPSAHDMQQQSIDASAHDSVLSNTNPNANLNIETPLIRSLRRVLQAFAIHCPHIGYCQSLNFLAALLLLLLNGDEEKSFHLLCIMTSIHLPGTHGTSLEGANVDIAVLMSLLKETLPRVWTAVNDVRTGDPQTATRLPTVSLATTSWFMSVFVGTLPIETVLRVWDVLFYEGSKTLFRVALAIFKMAETRVAQVRDPMEVFQLVQTLPRAMLDANRVIE
ncbi:RabGAP/TBC, partial [Viridothelium virens]